MKLTYFKDIDFLQAIKCRIQVISAKLVFDLFYVRIPVQVIESYIFS